MNFFDTKYQTHIKEKVFGLIDGGDGQKYKIRLDINTEIKFK